MDEVDYKLPIECKIEEISPQFDDEIIWLLKRMYVYDTTEEKLKREHGKYRTRYL